MKDDYPARPMVAAWVRYFCMAFGAASILGIGIDLVRSLTPDLFLLIGTFLVGSAWFTFGLYGGLPLVSTVSEWHPVATPDEVNDMHRQGLLVMQRRRWIMWASVPCAFAVAVVLIPVLIQAGQPGLIVLILGVPLAIINFRYLLSRCPRCGYGFFTRSKSRAATINLRKVCGHCGLSLYAYKDLKA
jgi:ribosomal protein S27AE